MIVVLNKVLNKYRLRKLERCNYCNKEYFKCFLEYRIFLKRINVFIYLL